MVLFPETFCTGMSQMEKNLICCLQVVATCLKPVLPPLPVLSEKATLLAQEFGGCSRFIYFADAGVSSAFS